MKLSRTVTKILLAVYAAVMIWFMLLTRIGSVHSNALSLVPFNTIVHFWNNLIFGIRYGIMPVIISSAGNLVGNIVFFIPLGLLVPPLWKAQRFFPVFFLTMTLVISVMEAVQFLSGLGTADIDDLILNLVGATIGYMIYKSGRARISQAQNTEG